jgi:hypothetical protein
MFVGDLLRDLAMLAFIIFGAARYIWVVVGPENHPGVFAETSNDNAGTV